MKFYCDSCNAKYLIGDEKVEGKVLRIRCKKCGHVIEVRGPAQLPVVAPPAPNAATAAASAVEWFYSRAGETFGPYGLEALQGMFSSGQLGDEAYVWHGGLAGWVPAKEQPEFQAAFSQGLVRKPPRPTMNLRADELRAALEEAQARAAEARAAEARPSAPEPSASPYASRNAPSNILKRAAAAHDQASGSPILSRPSAASLSPPTGAARPAKPALGAARAPAASSPAAQAASAEPADRLRALRERLNARAPGAATARPGASAPGVGASGVATRVPTGSIRERLAQRASSASQPAAQAPVAATQAPVAATSAPDPETVEASVPTAALAATPGYEPALTVEAELPSLERLRGLSAAVPGLDPELTAEAPAPSLELLAQLAAESASRAISPVKPAPKPEPDPEPTPEPAPEAAAPAIEELELEEDEEAEAASAAPAAPEVPAAAAAAEVPALEALLGSAAAQPSAPAPRLEDEDAAEDDALPMPPAPVGAGGLMPLPAGATAAQGDEGESRSLVLQLNELKQRNRRTRMVVGASAAAALFALAVGAVVYVLYFAGPSEQSQALAEQARAARERQAQEQVGRADFSQQKGYAPEQLAKMDEVIELGEDELVFDANEAGTFEAPSSAGSPAALASAPAGASSAGSPGQDRAPERLPGLKLPTKLLSNTQGASLDEALGSSRQAEGEGAGLKRRPGEEESTGQVAKVEAPGSSGLPGLGKGPTGSLFQEVSANRPRVEVERVERRSEGNGAAPSLPSTLDKQALVDGFRNVRRSADQCMERQAKRSGALPKGKVKVVVTIENSGAVSAVQMDPEVANTVFESCMRSHTGRWRFPAFGGEALHVARVFLLQ